MKGKVPGDKACQAIMALIFCIPLENRRDQNARDEKTEARSTHDDSRSQPSPFGYEPGRNEAHNRYVGTGASESHEHAGQKSPGETGSQSG